MSSSIRIHPRLTQKKSSSFMKWEQYISGYDFYLNPLMTILMSLDVGFSCQCIGLGLDFGLGLYPPCVYMVSILSVLSALSLQTQTIDLFVQVKAQVPESKAITSGPPELLPRRPASGQET